MVCFFPILRSVMLLLGGTGGLNKIRDPEKTKQT